MVGFCAEKECLALALCMYISRAPQPARARAILFLFAALQSAQHLQILRFLQIFTRILTNSPTPHKSLRTCFVCTTHAHFYFSPQHWLLFIWVCIRCQVLRITYNYEVEFDFDFLRDLHQFPFLYLPCLYFPYIAMAIDDLPTYVPPYKIQHTNTGPLCSLLLDAAY